MTEENIRQESQTLQFTDEWLQANSHVLWAVVQQKEAFLLHEQARPTVVYVPRDAFAETPGPDISELSGKLVIRQLDVILHDGDAIFCRRETDQTKKTETLKGINKLLEGCK